MRENCSRSVYNLQNINASTLLAIHLYPLLNLSKHEKHEKCLGAFPQLASASMLAWLLTMLLHHTPLLENFHDLLHGLSMLMNFCFIFPTDIFNWMSFPLDQVFKILFSPSLPADSLVNYAFHLWIFSYRHLFFPLNFFLFIFGSCFFSSVRVQIHNIEYR
jgi:hypothetical protein